MNRELNEIEEIDKTMRLVYRPKVRRSFDIKVKIHRVLADITGTTIDIDMLPNTTKYKRKWWANISREIYIRPVNTDVKLRVKGVINIPVSPDKFYFKSQYHKLSFRLIFPALPTDVMTFDLIESELPETDAISWFNFYGVSLEEYCGKFNMKRSDKPLIR